MRRALLAVIVWLTLTSWGEAQVIGSVNLTSGGDPGIVFVHVEDIDARILDSVFTDVKGRFRIEGIPINNRRMYLVIEEDGFKPIREELNLNQRRGALTIVYLEPEVDQNAGADGEGRVVDVQQLLANIPEEAREEYAKALEESQDGNHDEAIEHLEKAVELAPDYYDAWIDLGIEYVELGRFRDGEAAYGEALQSNPNGDLAMLNLGVLYYKEGEIQSAQNEDSEAGQSFEKARSSLEESIRLSPSSVPARFYLGTTLYKLGSYEEAEENLRAVQEIDASHAQTRLTLLNVYARQARYEAALEQADAFLEENPSSPQRPAIERVKSQIEAALGR